VKNSFACGGSGSSEEAGRKASGQARPQPGASGKDIRAVTTYARSGNSERMRDREIFFGFESLSFAHELPERDRSIHPDPD